MFTRLFRLLEGFSSSPIKVNSTFCTRVISPRSNCSACQDVCSKAAVEINDKEVWIDFDKCNGCGLCVRSCPNQVFALERNLNQDFLRYINDKVDSNSAAVIDCHQREESAAGFQTQCLGQISESLLFKSLFAGIDEVWLRPGDCSECSLQPGRELAEETVNNCNHILQNYGDRSRIFISSQISSQNIDSGKSGQIDRREFIVNLLSLTQKEEAERKEVINKTRKKRKELLTLIKRIENEAIEVNKVNNQSLFWQVEIDEGCDFCQACIILCPNEVLKLEEMETEKKILADNRLCTNCSLCEGICPEERIRESVIFVSGYCIRLIHLLFGYV